MSTGRNAIEIVRHFQPGAVHMGRLSKGADIIESLEEFCLEHDIRAAWVNVIGALDKATLSYYDQVQHQYFHKHLTGEYEIVSCSGNISLKDARPFAHLHAVLSGTDFATFGGHVWPGSVSVFAAEFVLLTFDKPPEEPDLLRCPDPATGLSLW